ncbi:unnamed protein product [Meloidogyne enterolobii]|uniref:Uncharacterized protein n=1 Tax=Meloidogyne enterolobii TaxID=390850 RepID=A0ACB0YMT3_MELEN
MIERGEGGDLILGKGCVNGLPKTTDGCSYSGQTESIHCYCQGELCNERIKLNNYLPAKLPLIECCECGGGEQQDQCPNTDNTLLSSEVKSSSGACSRVCRGNYCLVDFGGNEQGCGQGVPRLQNFLRISDYLNKLQGQLVCAYYQASTETIVNGCVCTEPSGNCNQRNRTWNHQMEKVLGRRTDDLNYCYSLHGRSDDEPINENIYKKSETCEGHFCFVSLSTREMAVEPEILNDESSSTTSISTNSFVGVSKQRFELLGGCLKVDDDNKVGIGCTIEYLNNSSTPLSVHCICNSHLCNYFEILDKATNGKLKIQKIQSSSDTNLKDSSFNDLQLEINSNKKRNIFNLILILKFLIIFYIFSDILF